MPTCPALASGYLLELLCVELLRETADEEHDLLAPVLHLHGRDIDPDEEHLCLDAGQVGDLAIGQLPGDGLFVVDKMGEVDVAWPLEVDLEGAVVGQGVRLDDVRHQALGQAVLPQCVVDGVGKSAVGRKTKGNQVKQSKTEDERQVVGVVLGY